MAQEPKSLAEIAAIVERCHFPGKNFRVGPYGDGFYVQLEYWEMDVVTGEDALQRGRKWIVSPFATKSEIVQTCFAACLASAEHQVREHFAYVGSCPTCNGSAMAHGGPCQDCDGTGRGKPRAIFGPHFSSDVLYSITGKKQNYDARQDPD